MINLQYFTHRIKAPQHNAHTVGIHARQQAKLGSILDQVYALTSSRKRPKVSPLNQEPIIHVDKFNYFYTLRIPCYPSLNLQLS